MTPMTLGVTLAVQQELEARDAETDALRRQHVERLRYEADLARRRYMKVDPDNRLVADALRRNETTSYAVIPMHSSTTSGAAATRSLRSMNKPVAASST
jgi:hypothetical protein